MALISSNLLHLRQYRVEPAFPWKGYGKAGIQLLMNTLWGGVCASSNVGSPKLHKLREAV